MADFRREYRISETELYDLDYREFVRLLTGLSPDSVWRQVTRNAPVELKGAENSRAIADL